MRKTKLIIFVISIAMIAMGSGYAAWTQTFTVTAQVDTGELSVLTEAFGDDTILRTLRILNSNNLSFYEISAEGGNTITGATTQIYLPPNQLNYVDVRLEMPADKESVILKVDEAFPGLCIDFDVHVTNEGTIPAVISNENPVLFVGYGANSDIANALVEQEYVVFDVQPNATNNPLGIEMDINGHLAIDIKMVIKSELPSEITIDEITYELEGINLSYELIYNIKQFNK